MSRLSTIFGFFFALIAALSLVQAAPLASVQTRQIGGLTCNLARLRIVGALRRTRNSVEDIDTSDATVAAAVTDAEAGLADARAGIRTIAGALLTGQDAPAAAREQVEAGLTAASTALEGISATPGVADAQGNLDAAISAGEDVVANCN